MSGNNLCWIVPGFQVCFLSFPHMTVQGSTASCTVLARANIVCAVTVSQDLTNQKGFSPPENLSSTFKSILEVLPLILIS